jgi:alpha-beta hydrolase superfamily lysophospholipase
MDLAIRRFGRPAREMVGVYQSATGGEPPRARFLLCRPLGQEAVRTAAIYRVVGERLARERCESLRFDYHGTGDSPGNEEDQSLGGWLDDTLAAHEQLQDHSDGAPVIWFGMGLGATLALRAAMRARKPPAQLVLWEPVLDGPTYVRQLMEGHQRELVRMFRVPWERLLASDKGVETGLPGDVLGFLVGPSLADELRQLRDVQVAPALRRGVRVLCAVPEAQRAHFTDLESHPEFRMHNIGQITDWMSSQAMGTAIVPPDLLRAVLSTLD